MFGWFDRDRLQSAGPNSHIAVTAAIPLPATIIVAVYGATEGKAPNASVKIPAWRFPPWWKACPAAKPRPPPIPCRRLHRPARGRHPVDPRAIILALNWESWRLLRKLRFLIWTAGGKLRLGSCDQRQMV